MKVIKFGGSSVATPERIKAVINIIKPYSQSDVAIVFSAFGGVTDVLIQLSTLALEGNADYKKKLEEIETRHLDAIRGLISVKNQSGILAQVKIQINELEGVLQGVFLVKERTLRTLDYIMSFGERLSAYIISEAMKDVGLAVEYLDARKVIRTDNQFGHAKVDFEVTNKLIAEHFKFYDALQIITGFIATSESGETTTLGRSGSDYTAAIFAGALKVSSLEIWTDVDGMMTADPRLVKKAFTIPTMSYEEAMELSHFGAKVIFPSTLLPAMAHNIPIWVKNTFNPSVDGTLISAESTNGKLIKGISSMNGISLLNIQGSGMLGVVGVSMRLFSTLAQEKVNVILISQASSEHSICIAIESSSAAKAKTALKKEFQHEIRNELIDDVHVTEGLSIVAIVGDGMKHHPGTSGRMFSALGKNGINIVAIAQGSSERNISVVIQQVDVAKALNVLHDAFFLSDRKTVNVFLAGTGLIGKALLNQVNDQFKKLQEENKLEVRIAGMANSKKMIFHEEGLSFVNAVENLKEKGEPMNLESFFQKMTSLNLPSSVFVDCTSSEDVAGMYESILDSNIAIVTPNKKANSGSFETYQQLKRTSRQRGVRFLYETNVGAGLPVINTLNDLLLSGDKVIRIEAVLSYTEPDPRDDLSGTDVARKILILSRECGLSLEPGDIPIQNLVPEDCRQQETTEEFLAALKKHDAAFEDLRAKAEAKQEKLRYQAILEDGKVKVELKAVNSSHPFYSLSGSDNIILLTTERYHERPMVIRGPGAGAEVTAAGVFADIIRIGSRL